jgi:hypothetical protein
MRKRREVESTGHAGLKVFVHGQNAKVHFSVVQHEHPDGCLLPSPHVYFIQQPLHLPQAQTNVAPLVVPQAPLLAMLQLLHAPNH